MIALSKIVRGFLAIVGGTLLLLTGGSVIAAEGGTSFYLLGQRSQGAAMLPPEGVFVSAPNYFYSGDFSRRKNLEIGGALVAGADVDLYLSTPTVIWVTPVELLGGKLALSGTAVVGYVDLDAEVTINIPGIGAGAFSVSEGDWRVGDPVFSAVLGWDSGNLHYTTTAALNVPVGDYELGRLNTALNRWVTDLTAAVTWLDPATGWEMSGAFGATFSGENDETDYETGDEIHIEAAVARHFSPKFSLGLNAYHYQQVSGDSGAGAVLGSFKGRVTGFGPTASANFQLGPIPVAAALSYFYEFNVKNRLEGQAGWLTLTIPLWVPNR
jgi:hypothetical protein